MSLRLRALLLVGLAACGPQSQVSSSEKIAVRGKIERESGAPAGNKDVRLVREPSAVELAAMVLAAPAFGLFCITRELTNEGCLTFRKATAGADGSFQIDLVGSETKKELNAARRFWAGATEKTGAGTAAVTIAFHAQAANVALPTVRFWESAPTLSTEGSTQSLSWSPLATGFGGGPDEYVVEIDAPASNGSIATLLWRAKVSSGERVTVPRAVLQDLPTTWRVSGKSTRPGPGTELEITQTAPAKTLDSPSLVPLSRGASCTYRSSKTLPETIADCPLTDGKIDTFLRKNGPVCDTDGSGRCAASAFEEVTVELPKAATAPTIALYATWGHAPREDVEVAVSADGATFTPLGKLEPFTTHATTGTVKYVRLRRSAESPSSRFDHLLNEIAVY